MGVCGRSCKTFGAGAPVVTLLILFSTITSIRAIIKEGDKLSNAVEIEFYEVSVSRWNAQSTDALFKKTITDECNTYCNDGNLASCGMEVAGTISSSDLVYTDSYPKNVKTNMKLKFFVSPVSGAALLPKSTLKQILASSRVKVKTATGYSIVDIDGTAYTKIADVILDISISVGATAFLLIIIITLVIYMKCRAHMAKKRQLENRIKQQRVPKVASTGKSRNGKVGHHGDAECGSNGKLDEKTFSTKSVSKQKLISEDETPKSEENGRPSSSRSQDNQAQSKNSSQINVAEEGSQKTLETTETPRSQHSPRLHQSNGFDYSSLGKVPPKRDLPPIDTTAYDDNVLREEKRKKKKKRKESREECENNVDDHGNHQLDNSTAGDSELEEPTKRRRRKNKKKSNLSDSHENPAFEDGEASGSNADMKAVVHHSQESDNGDVANGDAKAVNDDSMTTNL